MAELYISVMDACQGWLQRSSEIALQLLGVTAVIGFAIGIKDLVLAGNLTLDGIVALLVRYAFLVGVLVWILNAPQRLALITMSIKRIGATISGQDISFSGLITLFSDVTNPLVEFTRGLGWRDGGLFTASFYVIGYFRDSFISYLKALASVGVKMLMLCLCLGTMRNIMSSWPGMLSLQVESTESVFSVLMPMSCALMGFYLLIKSVPSFASSILTGSSSSLDGGAVKAAAMAGYALGATVISTSRNIAQTTIGGASTVSQAAQTFQHTSQAARDTGSTVEGARTAGAKEAAATILTGPQAGGPRAAGERIYADHQRDEQFADVRSGANVMAQPNQQRDQRTRGDGK